MADDPEGLNYDFNYNMRLAKLHFNKLSNYTGKSTTYLLDQLANIIFS